MKVLTSSVCFCLLVLAFSQTVQAQPQLANASSSSDSGRQPVRLNGQVRRVRVETANLLVKEGKMVEGPRVLREITTFDQKGQAIDSVSHPAEDGTMVGKKEYVYDARGNVIEMVLRGDDSSILSKEKYDYQFDEFGNWKKMTASIAVYENGNVGYEPSAVTYRTITYYYGQPAPKVITAPTATPVSNTSTTAVAVDPPKITKPTNDEPASVAATESATSGEKKTSNADEAIAVKPEKSEPPTPPPATLTSDTKKTSNADEAIAVKPEKSEPPTTPPAVVTPKDDAPRLPVIRISEEALRKAAIDLPQPAYPEAAKLARAEGNVEVQILVDEKGEVMNASVLSGNPLFSEVAVASARKAKFSQSRLSTDPARVYGVLTYAFTLPDDKPAPSPAANTASGELKASQPGQRVPAVTISQPVGSPAANPKPATDSPATAASHYTKGSTFLASGRYAEAAEELRKATERDPNDAAAYAKLGVAYEALQQHEEAVAVLKMAIRIKPEMVDVEGYYQLSNAYSALGKFSQALDALKQALYIKRAEEANPGEKAANTSRSLSLADIHYSMGVAYYNQGRYNEAIGELKRVIALNPKLMEAYYGLAMAYIAVGDRRSAEKQQKAAESLDPVYAAKIAKKLSSLRDQSGVGPRKSTVF